MELIGLHLASWLDAGMVWWALNGVETLLFLSSDRSPKYCLPPSPCPVVEHYKKTKSVYSEDPLRANELRITGAGKVHDLSTRASCLLKVRT